MSSQVRYAVFLEPVGELRDFVIDRKRDVKDVWPGAIYVGHSPHSTLWVGQLHDADAAENALRLVAPSLEEWPPVAGVLPHVFYDDVLADGGQTCALAIPLTTGLANLQTAVAWTLSPHIEKVTDQALPEALRHQPFLRSWQEYGFPFVGSHWIPHFTIASLPVPRTDQAVERFLEAPCPVLSAICDLSFWRVEGESHDRLTWLRRPSGRAAELHS